MVEVIEVVLDHEVGRDEVVLKSSFFGFFAFIMVTFLFLFIVPVFFLAMSLPLSGGEAGWRSADGMDMREIWRAWGGPIWCLLLMYFVMAWTALRWLSVARRPGRSGGSTA